MEYERGLSQQSYYHYVGCVWCGADCLVVVMMDPILPEGTPFPHYVGSCNCGRIWTRNLFGFSKLFREVSR